MISQSHPTITQAQAQSIVDDLQTALPYLQSALEAAQKLNLEKAQPDAYSDINDAIHYCASASDYLNEIEDA
jgi:recombinational DNA repair protein (RecF pathway)